MIEALLGRLGYDLERVVAHAGTRGIAIAVRAGSRELVTIVPGDVDDAVRAARDGWDLDLAEVRAVETNDGPHTILGERLAHGLPSTTRRASGRGVPAFVLEIAERMALAHRAGVVVGRLEPNLVFVDSETGALAGIAQRPLRADAAAGKGEGGAPLFGTAHLTPADVRGEAPTDADDAFRLASMIWRWRHGREPFAGLRPADRLSHLAGHRSDAAVAAVRGDARSPDALDALLAGILDPTARPGPGVPDLHVALSRIGEAW